MTELYSRVMFSQLNITRADAKVTGVTHMTAKPRPSRKVSV